MERSKVFISYRRADSAAMCDRIYARLAETLGRDAIFKDIDNIPLGVNFETYIQQTMAESAVTLVLIGRSWLDIKTDNGRRRLDDPSDPVRLEIEAALKNNIPVIPLMVDGAAVPSSADLSESLRPLVKQNGREIHYDPYFDLDMQRLTREIENWVPTPAIRQQRAEAAQREEAARVAAAARRAEAARLPSQQAEAPQQRSQHGLPLRIATGSVSPTRAQSTPLRHSHRLSSRPTRLFVTIAVLLILSLLGTLVLYQRFFTSPWVVATSPSNQVINGVSMASATDGWAVGGNSAGGSGGTLLHYANGHWLAVLDPTTASLYGISMVSATEGWVVGANGTILHYSGGQWSAVSNPPGVGDLYGIFMVSATDGWAVGNGGEIVHYSGGQWSAVHSPTTGTLYGISMVSANDGWAVGADSTGGILLHYTGGHWIAVHSPTSHGLTGISMVSATEGWAVGDSGEILHYSGGQWSAVTSPISNDNLTAVAMVSASEGWAVSVLGRFLHYHAG